MLSHLFHDDDDDDGGGGGNILWYIAKYTLRLSYHVDDDDDDEMGWCVKNTYTSFIISY